MSDLKFLTEQKEEKLQTLKNLITIAKKENRALSDEEIEEFKKNEESVKQIRSTINSEENLRQIILDDSEKEAAKTEIKNSESKEIRMLAEHIKSKVTGLQTRAVNLDIGNNGSIIPTTISKKIIEAVKVICPIYNLAEVFHIRGKLVVPLYGADGTDDITCAYHTEFTDLTSKSGKFTGIELDGYLAGALTKVSKMLINSNDFGATQLVNFVVKHMSEAIAQFLENELLNGTGTNACQGILTGATNKIDQTQAGAITSDFLIQLQETIPDVYQRNAVWIMNRADRARIRMLKDGMQHYLLNPDLTTMWGYTLLGKPVYTSDQCAAGKIIYGDMTGLTVNMHEDINIEVLREVYGTQHAIGVVGWIEVDSKVTDQQKLAVLYV